MLACEGATALYQGSDAYMCIKTSLEPSNLAMAVPPLGH